MSVIPADGINRLDSLIEGAGSIAVVTHTHPDGDALGSTAALLSYLRDCRGKDARVIIPDAYPSTLDFVVDHDHTLVADVFPDEARRLVGGADLIFCLDLNNLDRAACAGPVVRESSAPKVLVDHHLNPAVGDFDLVFSETAVSSASELLYQVLLALPGVGSAESLPAPCLTALMTGMTTDTNNFANSVFPSTLAMASSLLAAGVDRDEIIANLYNKYGENRFRAMGAVLSELLHITDDGVAYFIMDKAFMEKFALAEGDTESFVNLPLGIDRVRMSIFLKEDDGFFRVSVRSKKGVSANRLAAGHFNGGGHECAAGGRLYFPKDIAAPADAAEYIETVTARFMRNEPSA